MYQTLLVPLDGSKLAECVLPHVENLARTGQVRRIVLCQVAAPLIPHAGCIELDETLLKDIEQANLASAGDYLDAIAAQLVLPKGVHVETRVLSGDAAGVLADFAGEIGAELIVIATHGRSGIGRWMMGSVADRVLRSADVPVLMVRAARH